MRTYEQQLNYERLELITNPQPQMQFHILRLISTLQMGWETLVSFFALGSEPQVYQTSDASGQWWYVYDPMTGGAAWFSSESEVLEWLDNRHYR
ncbi:MAG: hypothetical protein SFY66_05740 [Oculatellaceae cyanobacterium bins.114]|nr:hypothetical protein [Oculatellaceae cyanobacterium bins.114]